MTANRAIHDAAMQRFNARNGMRAAQSMPATLAPGQAEIGPEGGRGRGGSGEAGAIQAAESSHGKVAEVPTDSLNLDPKRFQYKLNTSHEGVTDLLKGRRWNPDLSGVISVWRDPADGKTYVVNGHHRAVLAKEQGVPDVAVRYLDAPNAEEARATGALQNIAEGRGTPLDAAKFFRDSKLTPQDLDAKGISMGEATAANGLALANLSPNLFNDAVHGRLPLQRAIAIGRAAPTVEEQEALVALIKKAEGRGRHVSNETVEELGRLVHSSGTHTDTENTLFGAEERTRNLALEKAEISAYIRQTLSRERKLFAHVADEGRAEQLQSAGNKIKTKGNADIARKAAEAQELYDRLSGRTGTVNDILNAASEKLAKGENPENVKREAYRDTRAALATALRGGQGSGSDGIQAAPSGHPEIRAGAGAPQAQASNEASAVEKPGALSPRETEAIRRMAEGSRRDQERAAPLPELRDLNPGSIAKLTNGDLESLLTSTSDLLKARERSRNPNRGLPVSHSRLTEIHEELADESRRRQETNGGEADLEKAGQEPMFNRRSKPVLVRPEDSLALPGMENADRDGAEAAAEEQGRELTDKLNSPKGDIDKAAGEMEWNSPLFRDTEANPQGRLFSNTKLPVQPTPLQRVRVEVARRELQAAASRDRFENLARARFSLVPAPAAKAAPMLRLNGDGYMTFMRWAKSLRGDWAAVTIPRIDGEALLGWLRGISEKAPALDHLPVAFEQALTPAGIILLRGDAVASDITEEQAHLWDFRHRATSAAVAMRMARSPVFDRASNYLDVPGYRGLSLRGVVQEIAAKAMSGELVSEGVLTPAENRQLLTSYFDQVAQDGNLESLDDLPEMAGEANQIAQSVAEVHRGIEAKSRESGNKGIRRSAGGSPLSDAAESDSRSIPESSGGTAREGREEHVRGSGREEDKPLFKLSPVRDYLRRESELIRVSREVHSGLQDLDPQHDADVLRANQLLEKLPGTPADQEQVYHHLEDPKVPLTKTQREILSQLEPLQKQSEAIFRKLYPEKKQVANYVHRIAQQKGSLLDRILGGSNSTGRGNLLKRNAAAGKKRSMLAIESPSGERQVVSVGRGRVTAWRGGAPSDIGSLRSGLTNPDEILDERLAPLEREEKKLKQEQRTLNETPSRQAVAGRRLQNIANRLTEIEAERSAIEHEHLVDNLPSQLWRDKSGKTWTFKQATTKEIERETPVEYYKNAAASVVANWLELRKAGRAADYLDGLKANPDFNRLSIKPANPGQIPEGWKSTQLPQFMGYYFEPHIAEVLDDYDKELRRGNPSALTKANNFLTTAIFLNPVAHLPNLSLTWMIEKGISPLDVRRWGSEFRAGVKAFNAVAHQNRDFLEALDAGAPLQSQRQQVRMFAATLAKRLQAEAQNPGFVAKIEDALGSGVEENPLLIPGAIRWAVDNLSSKFTWPANDFFFLQSAYTKMDRRGMGLSQALKDTAQYIPDERLPARVLNSKALGDVLRLPVLMFTRWHYGMLKLWGKILLNLSGAGFHWDGRTINAAGEPLNAAGRTKNEERLKALNIAAGLALWAVFLAPAIDEFLRWLTGDKNSRLRRPGPLAIADAVRRSAEGEETPLEAARVAVTPSVLGETAFDLAANRDLFWNQQRIYNPHGTGSEIASEVGAKLLDEVSPAQLALRASESPESTRRTLYGLIGVSFPEPGAVRLAASLRASHIPDEARTPEQRRKSILASQARYLGWQGNLSGIATARKSGMFTPKEMNRLLLETRMDPLRYEAKSLNLKDLLTLYESKVTTQADRDELRPFLLHRAPSIERAPREEREALRKRLNAALNGGR